MHKRLFVVLLVLGVAALACSGVSLPGSGETTGTDTSGESGGAPAATGGDSPNPQQLNLDDPALYEETSSPAYEVRMDFNFTATNPDGSQYFRQVLVSGQRNQLPPRSYFRFEPNDLSIAGGLEWLEVADIEETDYLYSPSFGCIVTGNPEQDNPYNAMMDTGGLLHGTAQRVETGVTINGVVTDHYAITMDNVDLTTVAGGEVRSLEEGALYISQTDGAIIRLVLNGRGVSEVLTNDRTFEGDVRYQWDVIPASQPFDIQPPADCPPPGAEGAAPYPTLPDARNLTSLPGLMTYDTDMTLDVAIEFYKTEMAALGYTLTDETVFPPVGTLTFSSSTGVIVTLFAGPAASGTGLTIVLAQQ